MSDRSKSKGNDFRFEESGVSKNRVFEKTGFHCTCTVDSGRVPNVAAPVAFGIRRPPEGGGGYSRISAI